MANNKLYNSKADSILDQLKYEIANEFNVTLSGETSSRQNGSVGGEITRRLIQMGTQQLR